MDNTKIIPGLPQPASNDTSTITEYLANYYKRTTTSTLELPVFSVHGIIVQVGGGEEGNGSDCTWQGGYLNRKYIVFPLNRGRTSIIEEITYT